MKCGICEKNVKEKIYRIKIEATDPPFEVLREDLVCWPCAKMVAMRIGVMDNEVNFGQ